MNFVLIDGSYYVFFRYYALRVWWNLAKGNEETAEPRDSERFLDKYRTTFVSKLEELDKKLGIESSIKLVGKDCPREAIWRTKLFPAYKEGRKETDNEDISKMFQLTYNNNLFIDGGVSTILSDPALEADDCIALTAKHIIEKYPDAQVYVITSDMDYLQLAQERIHLYDLKFKNLTDSKSCSGDPKKDLFCKIVSGDKSDNIQSIFSRCGPKTAAKYYDDDVLFQKRLASEPEARLRYISNSQLIDFDRIPEDLVTRFRTNCLGLNP